MDDQRFLGLPVELFNRLTQEGDFASNRQLERKDLVERGLVGQMLVACLDFDFDRQGDGGRRGAFEALRYLIAAHPELDHFGLLGPLHALSKALLSLDQGTVEKMLTPVLQKAHSSFAYADFRGRAAGLSALLMQRHGRSGDDADKLVASRLRKAGYKKRRTGDGSNEGDREIKLKTLREWRREARNSHRREGPSNQILWASYKGTLAMAPWPDAEAQVAEFLDVLVRRYDPEKL